MSKSVKLQVVALVGVLVAMACQLANAQTLTKEDLQDLKQQVIQAIPKEVVQEIKQQFISEIKKELIAELKKELVETGKLQARQVVKELFAAGNPGGIKAALSAFAGSGNGDARSMMAALGKQIMKTRQGHQGEGGADDIFSDSTSLNGDLVAIVTNTSNPVAALTVEQVRKLYTGEYNNWSQVGGPNLPVRVVVWRDSLGGLASVMKSTVTPGAFNLSYLSLMIPAVDRTKGAVGFLPTANMEQLQFVTGHKALKKMAVKTDDEAPAVAPSLKALQAGTYPVVADHAGGQPGVHMQQAARVSLTGF